MQRRVVRAPASALADAKGACARQLTLLVRTYCHLCDDMAAALAPIAAGEGATIAVVDVDADDALAAAYGERVPVLFLGDPGAGRELCHFRLDAAAVSAALREPASRPARRREIC